MRYHDMRMMSGYILISRRFQKTFLLLSFSQCFALSNLQKKNFFMNSAWHFEKCFFFHVHYSDAFAASSFLVRSEKSEENFSIWFQHEEALKKSEQKFKVHKFMGKIFVLFVINYTFLSWVSIPFRTKVMFSQWSSFPNIFTIKFLLLRQQTSLEIWILEWRKILI